MRDDAIAALAAETLRAGLELKFRAGGTSMIPAVWPRDLLTIRPANGSMPPLGTIALTINQGRLRAHRVVARSDAEASGSITTRGDALASSDAIVQADEILGTVVARNDRPIAAPVGLVNFLNRASGHPPFRWIRLKCIAIASRAKSRVEMRRQGFSSRREDA